MVKGTISLQSMMKFLSAVLLSVVGLPLGRLLSETMWSEVAVKIEPVWVKSEPVWLPEFEAEVSNEAETQQATHSQHGEVMTMIGSNLTKLVTPNEVVDEERVKLEPVSSEYESQNEAVSESEKKAEDNNEMGDEWKDSGSENEGKFNIDINSTEMYSGDRNQKEKSAMDCENTLESEDEAVEDDSVDSTDCDKEVIGDIDHGTISSSSFGDIDQDYHGTNTFPTRTENLEETSELEEPTSLIRNQRSQCKNCDMTCSGNLARHIRTHMGEEPFKCDICNECFTCSDNLTSHMQIHTGEKLFKCGTCGKCFTRSTYLADHKRIHAGKKVFKCKFCVKCFTRSADRVHHMRIHTGEEPFKCQICDKCFSYSGSLVNHMRTHTGEKPFKCQICSKCFTRSDILADHMRTHTGEKPFKCEFCDKCFTQSSSRYVHMRTHTFE